MTIHSDVGTYADVETLDAEALGFTPVPMPLGRASGRYTFSRVLVHPLPLEPITPGGGAAEPAADSVPEADGALGPSAAVVPNVVGGIPALPLGLREDLRLDVDGDFPQMTASGTGYSRLTIRNHWIASLTRTARGWAGDIWYKDGFPALPYTHVDIRVIRPTFFRRPNAAIVRFSGGGAATLTREYRWTSSRFRRVEFEYDATPDANPVNAIGTHDHPNRPPALADESLTIDTVYARAGFTVASTGGGSVPVSGAGANGTWSDAEMHDAMQVYWSRFSNAPKWSMWVFSAALHDMGTSLGGIMFDDIGPNHRQGTAVFTESFIKNPPAGDPEPAAWVRRMAFWTTAHEMGHAFNLAHSWQKSLGTAWIPLVDEPEARSFMNYPYAVQGGEQAFFANFEYRFSDAELLFMRHAPERFVRMGDAAWFDHHGFEAPEEALRALEYRLVIRANRDQAVFEFLEPVVLEAKLTNEGRDPKVVNSASLRPEGLVVIIKPEGKPARQWIPYAAVCPEPRMEVLQPGASVYRSVPLFAGINGWDAAEPGNYDIQVAAEVDGAIVFSDPLRIRIAAPNSFEEESLAGDFFTEDVGRTLAFGGSAVLDSANDTLRETVDRLPDSRAAIHSAVALAQPLARDFKVLQLPETDTGPQLVSAADAGGKIGLQSAAPEEALELVAAATGPQQGMAAAETLGHIGYRVQIERFAEALATTGAPDEARAVQSDLGKVLAKRGVLPSVVAAVEERAAELAPAKAKPAARKKSR